MKNGWTGGQYSIVRAIFGAYLFIHFVALIPWAHEVFEQVLPRDASPLLRLFPNILAVADVAMPLVVSLRSRRSSSPSDSTTASPRCVIWYVLACLFGRNPLIANPSLPFAGWLLLAHAFVPAAPFGSWAARGRTDPRGGLDDAARHLRRDVDRDVPRLHIQRLDEARQSVLGRWHRHGARARESARASDVRADAAALAAVAADAADDVGALALELLYAPLALFRRVRPWIWLAMLAMHLGLMVLIDFADLSFMMVILHLFTFDPAWVRARARRRPPTRCCTTARAVSAIAPCGSSSRKIAAGTRSASSRCRRTRRRPA